MNEPRFEWDVFISYASGDRDSVAAPLKELLSAFGVRVWFDQTELLIGDSLRQRIDDGLDRSRYGIVVLSPAFFSRHWPVQELNGLVQREVDGRRVILPVWHAIGADEVKRYSPMLADRVAATSEAGVWDVALKILRVVRPDIVEKTVRKASAIVPLPQVTSGQELSVIVSGAHAYLPLNEEPGDEEEAALIGGFLQSIEDWGDILDDIGADARVRAQYSLSEDIKGLEAAGFSVYAARQRRRVTLAGEATDWNVAVVAVLRGAGRSPYLHGNQIFVERQNAKKPQAT